MNRAVRVLMGVGVLAILVPTLAVIGILPFGGQASESSPVGEVSAIADTADAHSDPRITLFDQEDSCSEAACSLQPLLAATTSDSAHSEPHQQPDTASTSSGPDESSNRQEEHGSGEATASTEPPTEQASTSSVQVDGIITGSACPCTVSGKVELQGDVSLQGDVTVLGGTLVARPGVRVNGNGHQIMFMEGGRADFQGTSTATWSGDGSTANLSRDVVFDNMSRIMWHEGGGASILRYVRITNSGVSEEIGFYPLHWHRNGNSTRGTLVEGVVVDNAKNHAFVPHASNGITFKDTIASGVVREAYWWDPGDVSNNIVYDHALAVNVDYPRSYGNLPLHHRMSAFFLGKGSGNVVRNSVARSTRGGADCSGFHWPEHDHGVWAFQNNAAYGDSCHGIFVWQNDSLAHVIQGFSGATVKHGAYVNQFKYFDLDVSELVLNAVGRDDVVLFEGGRLGNVLISEHALPGLPVVFRNVAIKSFTIDNASGEPGVYQLEGTNLKCSDIRFASTSPGTKVIINGVAC